jgi:hypothetical protein
MENEAINGSKAYSMQDLFTDTQRGIFAEAYSGAKTDVYRRNLQRAYIDQLAALMGLDRSTYEQSDIQAMARATLAALQTDLQKAAKKQGDNMTKAHFVDLVARIDLIQEGKTPGGSGSNSRGFQPAGEVQMGCWSDDSYLFLNQEQGN